MVSVVVPVVPSVRVAVIVCVTMFVFVKENRPVPVPVLVSDFVSPASAESAANVAMPRWLPTSLSASVPIAQFTAAAVDAIATRYRSLDSMSLPRFPAGSAQTLQAHPVVRRRGTPAASQQPYFPLSTMPRQASSDNSRARRRRIWIALLCNLGQWQGLYGLTAKLPSRRGYLER